MAQEHLLQNLGYWIYFYDKGGKKSKGSYFNDFKYGLWTFWYTNGNKQSEGYYKKDMKNSLWINWYANKEKREVGHYINNKEDGEWVYMSENGEKILDGFFSKGWGSYIMACTAPDPTASFPIHLERKRPSPDATK